MLTPCSSPVQFFSWCELKVPPPTGRWWLTLEQRDTAGAALMEPWTHVRQAVWHRNNCLGAAAPCQAPSSGPPGPHCNSSSWGRKTPLPWIWYHAGEVTARLGSWDTNTGTAGPKTTWDRWTRRAAPQEPQLLKVKFHPTQQGLEIAEFWFSLPPLKSDAHSSGF